MTTEQLYALFLEHPQVTKDSRAVTPGCLYFGLRGEKFDGNAFAEEALARGAAYAVIDNPAYQKGERYILVEDALGSLQALARHHRGQLQIPVLGLTGSNGKTTTKELLRSVLATGFEVLATSGNLNNHIGVPLTLLQIHAGVEVAIVEMGANHPGEIAFLCGLAAPTHGLITNVGKAHLEGFGSFEGVKKTKGELYDYLAGNGGLLFLQGDNPVLRAMALERFPKAALAEAISYGPGESNRFQGEVLAANPYLKMRWQENDGGSQMLQTQLAGAYNLENVLAAIAVGKYFGLSDAQVNQGVQAYSPSNNRSQIVDTANGNRIIGDYYNANASSMAAALESFRQLSDERPKVVILGDMYELGASAPEEHQKVIQLAMEMQPELAIFIGHNFFQQQGLTPGAEAGPAGSAQPQGLTARAAPVQAAYFFATLEEARAALLAKPLANCLVLLKGSRSIALERLIDLL